MEVDDADDEEEDLLDRWDGTFLDPLKHIRKNDGIVSKYLSGGQVVHRPPQCVFVNIDADDGGSSFFARRLLLLPFCLLLREEVSPPPLLVTPVPSGGCIQYGPSTLQS